MDQKDLATLAASIESLKGEIVALTTVVQAAVTALPAQEKKNLANMLDFLMANDGEIFSSSTPEMRDAFLMRAEEIRGVLGQ